MDTTTRRPKTKRARPGHAVLDARAAAAIALQSCLELYPDLGPADLMLEEVEETADGRFWLITLGFDVQRKTHTSWMETITRGQKSEFYRAYKSFKIDKATGKVLSMKIRSVA